MDVYRYTELFGHRFKAAYVIVMLMRHENARNVRKSSVKRFQGRLQSLAGNAGIDQKLAVAEAYVSGISGRAGKQRNNLDGSGLIHGYGSLQQNVGAKHA